MTPFPPSPAPDLVWALEHYPTTSEGFWRALEMSRLREICGEAGLERPILEIGCGDGALTARLFDRIDEGVDLNPRAVERARATGVYGRVRCADAAHLEGTEGTFASIFSNCVLEHVSDLPRLLTSAARLLRPGGKLIATVPLLRMNDHLAFRAGWYATLRRRQLSHVNLLDESGWESILLRAGFHQVRMTPYLHGEHIRVWDRLDFPASIGVGRYRVSTAARLLMRVVPGTTRARWRDRAARSLSAFMAEPRWPAPCAAVLVAVR